MRRIFIELPVEAGYGPDTIGLLFMCLYGLHDAGQAFEFCTLAGMTSMGLEQGMFPPCLYYHLVHSIRTWVHGDDFVSVVPRSQHKWFIEELGKLMIVKVMAVLGAKQFGPKPDDRETRILNRLITWVPGRPGRPDVIEWEADPRHVNILMQQMGFTDQTKSVTTPGVKGRVTPLDGPALEGDLVGTF
jgi:hypothetical protein